MLRAMGYRERLDPLVLAREREVEALTREIDARTLLAQAQATLARAEAELELARQLHGAQVAQLRRLDALARAHGRAAEQDGSLAADRDNVELRRQRHAREIRRMRVRTGCRARGARAARGVLTQAEREAYEARRELERLSSP